MMYYVYVVLFSLLAVFVAFIGVKFFFYMSNRKGHKAADAYIAGIGGTCVALVCVWLGFQYVAHYDARVELRHQQEQEALDKKQQQWRDDQAKKKRTEKYEATLDEGAFFGKDLSAMLAGSDAITRNDTAGFTGLIHRREIFVTHAPADVLVIPSLVDENVSAIIIHSGEYTNMNGYVLNNYIHRK